MNKIEIYKDKDGNNELAVNFDGESVWLSQKQIVEIFEKDQSVISRHINNIFKDNEVDKKSNMQKMHIANSDKPVELYPSIEDKASHLLYFIIKDHPFNDGNKRSASFMFIYFLDRCDYLYKTNGEKKINDNALTTLTLLVASSDPKEKDILIKLIKHLLFESGEK